MNPDNYGTLEACQSLVDKGIVMETERAWAFVDDGRGRNHWKIISVNTVLCEKIKYTNPEYVIPAPSMAEMWRELPEHYNGGRKCLMMVEALNIAGYSSGNGFDCSCNFTSSNPTDALIHLRIWVKGEEAGMKSR
jgi:hypothetical protein